MKADADKRAEHAKVVSLKSKGPRPPTRSDVQWEMVDRWQRKSITGATPALVASVILAAERGEMEDFADLAEYMLRTDAHGRSAYETLLLPIAGAEIEVEAGRHENEALAESVAEEFRKSLELTSRIQNTILHLAHAAGMGASVLEHQWQMRAGGWHSVRQKAVAPRDLKFGATWDHLVRTRTIVDGRVRDRKWISCSDRPDKWLVHNYTAAGMSPNVSGLLMAWAWTWLFKIWALKNGNIALERIGIPILVGKVADNTNETTRAQMLAALEDIAAGHAAVTDINSLIEVLDASSASAGTAHRDWATYLDDQATKAFLGSTLNSDIGGIGSKAAAESQATQTILPRHMAVAASVAEAIEDTWVEPWVYYNQHFWPSVHPSQIPRPRIRLRLEAEDLPEVDQLLIDAGAASVDELRESRKLPVWGPERGGDRIARPVAKARGKIDPVAPEAELSHGEQAVLPWGADE